MVVFVTLQEGARHVDYFLRCFGHAHARRLSEITYHTLARRSEAPCDVYVFCDRDRMSEAQKLLASHLWRRLSTAGPSVRLLNDPLRGLPRYDLLKSLHRQGVNDFDLWCASALPEHIRFPAFVRLAKDHSGPKTDLVEDRPSLDRALAAMLLLGYRPEDLLVVEYVHTADAGGIFRTHGAFRIGNAVFGQHVLLGLDWRVKNDGRLATREALEENSAYFLNNPHADLLMPFFERAGVEYGRIDYSFAGDRIQIWEINDNPQFAGPNPRRLSTEPKELVYLAALDALGEGLEQGGCVPLDAFDEDLWPCLGHAVGRRPSAPTPARRAYRP